MYLIFALTDGLGLSPTNMLVREGDFLKLMNDAGFQSFVASILTSNVLDLDNLNNKGQNTFVKSQDVKSSLIAAKMETTFQGYFNATLNNNEAALQRITKIEAKLVNIVAGLVNMYSYLGTFNSAFNVNFRGPTQTAAGAVNVLDSAGNIIGTVGYTASRSQGIFTLSLPSVTFTSTILSNYILVKTGIGLAPIYLPNTFSGTPHYSAFWDGAAEVLIVQVKADIVGEGPSLIISRLAGTQFPISVAKSIFPMAITWNLDSSNAYPLVPIYIPPFVVDSST